MSDTDYGELVKRLRIWPYGIRLDAADAIERQASDLAAARREIDEKVSAIEAMDKAYMDARREAEDLRAELTAIKAAYDQVCRLHESLFAEANKAYEELNALRAELTRHGIPLPGDLRERLGALAEAGQPQ